MIWSLLSLLTLSHAAPIDVRITYELRIEGRQICSGTQVITAGKAAELCVRDYNEGTVKFRAKVRPQKDHQFLVSGYISEHDKDGMPVSMSSPQIKTLENERAEISTANEDEQEVLSFSAIVSRIH